MEYHIRPMEDRDISTVEQIEKVYFPFRGQLNPLQMQLIHQKMYILYVSVQER